MKNTLIEPSTSARTAPALQPLEAMARRAVLVRLAALEHGALRLEENGVIMQFGTVTARCPLSVTVRVHDPRFYTDIAFGGSIGAATGAWLAGRLFDATGSYALPFLIAGVAGLCAVAGAWAARRLRLLPRGGAIFCRFLRNLAQVIDRSEMPRQLLGGCLAHMANAKCKDETIKLNSFTRGDGIE